jgi:hypothetical protein
MNSIPASALVSVQPSVISAGGSPLSLNAIFLTQDPSIPIGTIKAFPSLLAVQNWFGANSVEAGRASKYFGSFIGADQIPGTLYFAQFNTSAVAGYLRGASLAGVSLTTIQGLSGTLTLTIDGVSTVSAAINLSAATSFSNAAALIQTGLQGGTPTNTATVTYDSLRSAFVVTSPTTGGSSSIGFATVDSIATGLGLTAAAGATQSPGAAVAVPSVLMTSIVNQLQNWFSFTNVAEPVDSIKLQFAAWVNGQNARYKYVQSDSSNTPTTGPAANSFGVLTSTDTGVVAIYDPTGGDIAAFECGVTASINSNEPNGRITFAFKGQAGLTPSVTDQTTAANLVANFYNFYGQYATAAQQFQFYQPGQISGAWLWDDSYTDQVILNNALQLSLVELLANVKSIPYNNAGYSLIRAACADPINSAISFGSIVAGVDLSAAQIAEVNQAAGLKIDSFLFSFGYYLQIRDPGSVVRGQRGSPIITLWYVDGESVQKINLASIDIL